MSLVGFAAVAAAVFAYLQTVGLRHDVEERRAGLDKLRIENVELKNKFFQLVDSENLVNIAEERGLVREKNPQWVSGSQL